MKAVQPPGWTGVVGLHLTHSRQGAAGQNLGGMGARRL